MDDLNFCPACGKELPPGTVYCTMCGSRLHGARAPMGLSAAEERENGERIKIAVIFLIITAVTSVISGIYFFFNAAAFVDTMVNIFPSWMLTEEMIASMEGTIKLSALISIVGGAIAVIAAVSAHKRRMYAFTMVLCVVAALIGSLLFGLIAAYLIHKAEQAFTD